MRQSAMLLRLSIKRAAKKLPQLILGSLVISAVVVMVVLFCAYSRNKESVLTKTRLALVAGNNEFFKELAGKMLGSMESADSMLSLENAEEADALKRFDKGDLEGVIVFPENYLDNLGRGEDVPATIYIKNDGVAYDLGIIIHLAGSAETLLTSAEAANYAVVDVLRDAELKELANEFNDATDMTNFRMVLSRENNFTKLTLVGDGDTTLTQSYACAALVMLMLLWGLSCGAMIKSEGAVMSGKLAVSGVSVFKQELIRLVSVVFLLGTMLFLVFAALLLAFPSAKGAFEQINVYEATPLILLFVSLLPALVLAGAIVLFCFTVTANEIGGILLLFTGTIVSGYISGCLLPLVYLPHSIRNLAKFFPTYYMHSGAEKGLTGSPDGRCIVIELVFALGFFLASYLIRIYKNRREL